jgi:hypothetical protein
MRFTTTLEMEPTGKTRWGRPEYRLTAPLIFESIEFGIYWYVPPKFVTDLASTPWGFRWLLAKWPEPAVLHDYQCQMVFCSRFYTDASFREVMQACGVPRWRRVLAYYAVRIGAILRGKT